MMKSSYPPAKRIKLPCHKQELVKNDNYSDISSDFSDLPDLESVPIRNSGCDSSQGDGAQMHSVSSFPPNNFAQSAAHLPLDLQYLSDHGELAGAVSFSSADISNTVAASDHSRVPPTGNGDCMINENRNVEVQELSHGSHGESESAVATTSYDQKHISLSPGFMRFIHEDLGRKGSVKNIGGTALFQNISDSDSCTDENEITRTTSVLPISESASLLDDCNILELPLLSYPSENFKKYRCDKNTLSSVKHGSVDKNDINDSGAAALSDDVSFSLDSRRSVNECETHAESVLSFPANRAENQTNRNPKIETAETSNCSDVSKFLQISTLPELRSGSVESFKNEQGKQSSTTAAALSENSVTKMQESIDESVCEIGSDSLSDCVDLTINSETNYSAEQDVIIVSSSDGVIHVENPKSRKKRKLQPIDNKVPVIKLARIDISGLLASSTSSCLISSPETSQVKKAKNITRKRPSLTHSTSRSKRDDSTPLDVEFNKLCLSDCITYDDDKPPGQKLEELSMSALSAIEACLDDNNEGIAIYGIYLLYAFSKDFRIPDKTASSVFQQSFLESNNLSEILQCYCVFRILLKRQQGLLKFKWEKLSEFLNKIVFSNGHENNLLLSIKGIFYLKLMTDVFTREILGTDLGSIPVIRTTATYKTLSSDCAYCNQKQIVQWLSPLLSNHPLNTIQFSSATLGSNIEGFNAHSVEIPSVMPLLQKLLALAIDVSSQAIECSKRLSHLLAKTYIYLPELSQKTVLIKSVRSRLLRFKLIQNILENYSDRSYMCAEDFPVSLASLVEAYYSCYPPRNKALLTPSDDEDERRDVQAGNVEEYSMAECEELAMLLYYLTYSYLKCSYRRQHEQLKNRARRKKHQLQVLHIMDCKSVQKLPQFVRHLQSHLERMVGNLSPGCVIYLDLITALSGICEEL